MPGQATDDRRGHGDARPFRTAPGAPRPAVLLLGLLALLLAAPPPAEARPRRGGGRPRAAPTERRARAHKAPAAPAPAPERKADEVRAAKEDEATLRRGERVEFDGRLIEGQTAAAGAIYLFERLPSELRSMVMERQSYKREVLETLYPNGVPPPAEQRGERAKSTLQNRREQGRAPGGRRGRARARNRRATRRSARAAGPARRSK